MNTKSIINALNKKVLLAFLLLGTFSLSAQELLSLERLIQIHSQKLETLNDSLINNGWDYNTSNFGGVDFSTKSVSWKHNAHYPYHFEPYIERGINKNNKYFTYYRTWDSHEYIQIKEQVEDSTYQFKLIESNSTDNGKFSQFSSTEYSITFIVVGKKNVVGRDNEDASQNYIIAIVTNRDLYIPSSSEKVNSKTKTK